MNAVVRAVTLTAINKYGCEVIGFKKGYAGLYANNYMQLTAENTAQILNHGGTILKNSNKDNLFNYAYRDENGNIQHKDVSDVAVHRLVTNLYIKDAVSNAKFETASFFDY